MRSFTVRRGLAACAVSAATLAAMVAPSVASAKKITKSVCTGVSIVGNGASSEYVAQKAWWTEFSSAGSNPFKCTSGSPTVLYYKTSSGKGLNSWGAGGTLVNPGSPDPEPAGFGAGDAFLGAEEAPNTEQAENIEKQEEISKSVLKTVLTVPLVQEAIAVIVHLPAGCTATSTSNSGRLVLNSETLAEIFAGTRTSWTSITDGGDTFTGTCSTPIQRVVRGDQSGTTNKFKRYLDLIKSNPEDIPAPYTGDSWAEIAQNTPNTVWPTGAGLTTVIQGNTAPDNTEKDTGEINTVVSTASSIGYGILADAGETSGLEPSGGGGPGTSTFWAPLQDSGLKAKGAKYADPAVDGEVNFDTETNGANCAKTKYTNGPENVKFPPSFLYDDWSPVTTSTKEKNYPLCGIGYGITLNDYKAFPGTSAAEVQTVTDYFHYVLSTATGGGQTLLEALDYEALPKSLDSEAVKGIEGSTGINY
jgi:ABC-type phosphate transport system substrate-binding protein